MSPDNFFLTLYFLGLLHVKMSKNNNNNKMVSLIKVEETHPLDKSVVLFENSLKY